MLMILPKYGFWEVLVKIWSIGQAVPVLTVQNAAAINIARFIGE